MKSEKSSIWFYVKLVISTLLIAALVYQASSKEDVLELVRKPKRWDWFALALLMQTVGYTISHVRWWLLANAVRVRLTLPDAIKVGFIALPFHLIAFGVAGGDLLRTFYVCRDHPERKKFAFASVLLDRVMGLMTMFLCVAATALFVDWDLLAAADANRTQGLRLVCMISFAITATGTLGYLAILLLGRKKWVNAFTATIESWFGKNYPGRGFLTSILDVSLLYRRRPAAIFLSFFLSLGVVASLSSCVFCIAMSLTTETPSLANHFIITPISLIAGAAPLPGGLGSQEFVMSWLYSAFSTEQQNTDYGLLVALGYRTLTFVLMGLGLLVYLSGSKKERHSIDKALQAEVASDKINKSTGTSPQVSETVES